MNDFRYLVKLLEREIALCGLDTGAGRRALALKEILLDNKCKLTSDLAKWKGKRS